MIRRTHTLGDGYTLTADNTRVAIQAILVSYLTDNATDGRLPVSGINPDTRYLDVGILNSLGLVTFIEFAEGRFGVRFSAEDLQSYEFQTPAGVAEIVEALGGSVADV